MKQGDENELERNVPVSVYRIAVSVYRVPLSVYHVPVSREGGLYKQFKFAMETDVERKARLEKMVATTQLRLALETEEERGAKKGMNLIYI